MPLKLLLAICLWTFLLPALCGGGVVVHACAEDGEQACSHDDSCDHDPCSARLLRPTGLAGGWTAATICAVPARFAPRVPPEAGPPAAWPTAEPQRPPGLPVHESDLPLLI